jgi:hypothetical protein
MSEPDTSGSNATRQAPNREGLRRLVSDSKRNADAAIRDYERTAWITYGAIFVPIPFAVLPLRFHLEAWGYYVAGALFMAVPVLGYAIDLVAVAKRDRIVQSAERAQEAYERTARTAGEVFL